MSFGLLEREFGVLPEERAQFPEWPSGSVHGVAANLVAVHLVFPFNDEQESGKIQLVQSTKVVSSARSFTRPILVVRKRIAEISFASRRTHGQGLTVLPSVALDASSTPKLSTKTHDVEEE